MWEKNIQWHFSLSFFDDKPKHLVYFLTTTEHIMDALINISQLQDLFTTGNGQFSVNHPDTTLAAALPFMHHFRSFKIISTTLNTKSLSLIRSCSNFSESSINLTTLCKSSGHK